MDRQTAYVALAEELERQRRLPLGDLVSQVGAPPFVKAVQLGDEIIDIEVRLRWADSRHSTIRIEAVANGPSCWSLERLEEAITVSALDSQSTSGQ